jgi:aerobic-type carbon monoxide dehydrogenase small subunit (CoxS/CutS family)
MSDATTPPDDARGPAPASPAASPPAPTRVSLRLNGAPHSAAVEPRTLLSDFIRDQGLTGTKVGCEHGECGACTVQLDGEPVRSCLLLAVQAEGCDVRTIEGLAPGPLQTSFHRHHALQCGFCTAGILMTLDAYLEQHPDPTERELKDALAGNLCRCTGYKPIIEAVLNR